MNLLLAALLFLHSGPGAAGKHLDGKRSREWGE